MKYATAMALALAIFFAGAAVGQKDDGVDGPVGIFSSGAEYDQFMRDAKRVAYGDGGSDEMKAMIPMLNDIALNKPLGWTANEYGATGNSLGLLSDKAIRNDLEMVDSQYEELQQLSSQIQERVAKKIRNLDFSDRDTAVSQIRSIRKQAMDDLNEVLLPHQLQRLNQIRMQALLQRRSLVEVLTSDPVKSELAITDQQSNELKEFEKVVQEDLAKEIAKLHEKARDRLLSKLSSTQKKQAVYMIGDAFVFSQPDKRSHEKKTKRPRGQKKIK